MVIYYSASGNSRFIAEQLAELLDDKCLDLKDRIRSGDNSKLCSKKPFIICSPVYVCEMPRFVSYHLKHTKFCGNRNVYFVFTSGGYAGMSGSLAKRIVKNKKMIYKGHAEIKMPSNHVVSNMYPPTEHDECVKRINAAVKEVKKLAKIVQNEGEFKARHVFLYEKMVILPFNPFWAKYMQPTKGFFTTDKCIGCGLCQKSCPINNIKIVDKHPVWINKQCAHCMACILNCPFEAIEYADITQKKEKYNIKKYLRSGEIDI